MLEQINRLSNAKIENLKIGTLGKSLTGVEIPLLMLGKD
jgi:hypothetical protein